MTSPGPNLLCLHLFILINLTLFVGLNKSQSLAASKSWHLFQLDINNAFLHGSLDEDVYMDPSSGCWGQTWSSLQAVTLRKLFTIKDLSSAKYFLGLELARSSHGLQVSQHKYLHNILADTSMLNAKPAPSPFLSGLKLASDDGSLLHDPSKYMRLVGRLLYMGFTRSNISFAVQQLSQFLQVPRTSHWDATLHVLRRQRIKPPSRDPSLKQNNGARQQLFLNCSQFPMCYATLMFSFPSQFLFGVTTTLPFTSQPTLPFMSTPSILTSTVIWCMTSTSLGLSLLHMFLVPLNLQTSLPSLFLLSTSFFFCPRWACPSVQSILNMWCKQSRGALIDTLCEGRLED
ncbi:UNVERIFIED_CONTAM: Retrovirus-related Pol polyprotein from transposon RE2 [Sesamum angustifolium]|uniref:Retrovirus-related Pol polyprotein from transposon RE2 n=1 Tax=Sesamum angustifolium TaxID=2727405 RepID=A0AAW2KX34_9LAMI